MPFLKREYAVNAMRNNDVSNLSNNYDFACFFADDEPYCSCLYVVTDNLEIKFQCKTDCYIHCCGISATGRYVIFQTANAPDASRSDGNMHFFVDVEQGQILWKMLTETPFRTISNYFIDENKKIIYENHADYHVTYDFNGNFLDKYDWLHSRGKHSDSTFYELLEFANQLLDISIKENLGKMHEHTILYLLNAAVNKGVSSEYQLANTYKLLGDFYFNFGDGMKALDAYKTGVNFYPKLPVKRIIKTLSNSLGIDYD